MLRLGLSVIALALLAWGLLGPYIMYTSPDALRTVAVGRSVTIAWSRDPRVWVTAPGFSMNRYEGRSIEGHGLQPWPTGVVRRTSCPLWLPAALCLAWPAASCFVTWFKRIAEARARRSPPATARGFEVVLGGQKPEPGQSPEAASNGPPDL